MRVGVGGLLADRGARAGPPVPGPRAAGPVPSQPGLRHLQAAGGQAVQAHRVRGDRRGANKGQGHLFRYAGYIMNCFFVNALTIVRHI